MGISEAAITALSLFRSIWRRLFEFHYGQKTAVIYLSIPRRFPHLISVVGLVQEGDDLRSRAGRVGTEGRRGGAAGDALTDRPLYGVVIVRSGVHIGKRSAARSRGAACRLPEEGHRLRPGADIVRAEGCR